MARAIVKYVYDTLETDREVIARTISKMMDAYYAAGREPLLDLLREAERLLSLMAIDGFNPEVRRNEAKLWLERARKEVGE
jgi:hypothetical protein